MPRAGTNSLWGGDDGLQVSRRDVVRLADEGKLLTT
jgi:hypothetical protein